MRSSSLRPRYGHHTRICYHWFRQWLVTGSVLTEVSTNIALLSVSSGSSLPKRKQIIYFHSIKSVQNAVFPLSVFSFKGHRVLHHTIFQLSVNLWFKQMNTTYRALSNWRCRKHFSQWERSFQWKLCAHWIKCLRERPVALVKQDAGMCDTLHSRYLVVTFSRITYKVCPLSRP